MRVFLDANILFSGAQTYSRMRALLLLHWEHAECVTNDYAVEEARRNLDLKFPVAVPHLAVLVRKCEIIDALAVELTVELKAKDRPILGEKRQGAASGA
jgi:hypothetical protein